VQNAGAEIKPIASKIQEFLSAHDGFGEVKVATNGLHFWIEHSPVPMLGLFVGAGRDVDHDYLLGGLGNGVPPASAKTNSPPAELMANVNGHPNLLYYDWEITSERLAQLRIVSGLFWILVREKSPTFVPASQPWLEDLNGILGNTGTKINVVSPTELELIRSSHIGLTAAELLILTKWLESPAFPEFKLPEISAKPMLPGEK
jgi:hypothetical protein